MIIKWSGYRIFVDKTLGVWAMENRQREKFSSGLAVFFATLGSAVGLGNIWKFPYLTGNHGGGAFLLIYLLCVLLIALPVMNSEFFIGRRTRRNAVGAFESLKPHSAWKVTGLLGVLAAYLIMFFYSSVAGWVYSYVFRTIRGDFSGITPGNAQQVFSSTIENTWSPILWQIIAMGAVSAVLISGVRAGIERITKTLMPVLLVLVLVCDIRSLFLPGASEGLRFLFHVDFTKITPAVILTALGLAFFKLSLGMGTMITYGSYFTEDNPMPGTSARVALSDTAVSILAGMAIFPAVFSFGMKPDQGAGLLFLTVPLVFSKIIFGNVLLTAFFLLASIAATTAMISLVEVPVAYLTEEKKIPRRVSVLINFIVIVTLGSLASLSAGKASRLSNVKLLGFTFFDLFDYLSSNILLPVGGLLILLFTAYVVGRDAYTEELTNHGALKNKGVVHTLLFLTRYVTPVLLLLVFLNSIGVIRF